MSQKPSHSLALAIIALMLGGSAFAATPHAAAHPRSAAAPANAPATIKTTAATTSVAAKPDSAHADMTLRGNQEGTVFRSLTVEGEDRIHIDFERPPMRLELQPEKAPGLDWGSARDVLDRTTPDLAAPLLAASAQEASPYVARPWLAQFASGPVARIQPDVKGVESWTLTIANARGEVVQKMQGHGEPPHEIAWDGRLAAGGTLTPGATYSYVLEAHDKAGNKRNFVGEGFRVNAVRFDGPGAPALAFTGQALAARAGTTPEILLEAASWLNQWPDAQAGIRVETTGRSYEEANALAQRVVAGLTPALLGDPARVRIQALVATDAPEGGAVRITPGK